MNLPRISIVIPVFNCAESIGACLESILSQSFTGYEVLLMGGLSTDATPQICAEYARRYPSIFYSHEKDQGIYDAMNKGIAKSKGQWLYFLGGDDVLFDNEVLEKFSKAAAKYPVKMLYANVLVNGDTVWAKDKQVYDGYFNTGKLLTKNICHQAILYHKDVFNACGNFNLKYVVCADYDINLKIAAKFPTKYLNFIAAVFKTGGASSTITDHAFMADLNRNLISYFYKQLYKPWFRKLEHHLVSEAKNGSYNATAKAYLFCVGYYFKLQRKLKLT